MTWSFASLRMPGTTCPKRDPAPSRPRSAKRPPMNSAPSAGLTSCRTFEGAPMRSAIKGGTLMHWQKVMFPSGGTQSTRPGPRPGGSPSLAATCSESRPVTPARPAAELAYLRTKPGLPASPPSPLFQPRFVLPVKGDVMTTSILVTGGTGTLGRPVAQRLRDAGASVTVLSRHPRETVKGIRYTAGDLSTGAGIEAAVRGAEVIVHAAGGRTGDEQKTRTLVSAARDA